MFDQTTSRLELPLVQPGQAQKHVTVNEALARLDGMVNLVLVSITRTEPPAASAEGACFGVPAGASGLWTGRDGQIAIAANGGWDFCAPRSGMGAHITDQGVPAIHDGDGWVTGALTLAPSGAGLIARTAEAEVAITPGTTVETDLFIPSGVLVIGVTARVRVAISGTLTSWRMGVADGLDRFGGGLGLQAGSWARGLVSQPYGNWSPEPVLLSATGGSFAAGGLVIAAHWLELGLPR
ncbi:MAG: DUF2793 domain-containing protein [Paracoccus sp. (in: a-proteobacteria)]|nr:DUF2793 domain-containing protein [Paracoccus sp. (in: a-proteobacteria)]